MPLPKLPKWLTVDGWLDGSINLTDYDLGVVKIRDASGEALDEYDRCFAASNGKLFLRAQAALLRAYVHDGASCAMPSRGASVEAWCRWVEKQRAKPLTRLVRGILEFRTILAKLDEDDDAEPQDAAGAPQGAAEPSATPTPEPPQNPTD